MNCGDLPIFDDFAAAILAAMVGIPCLLVGLGLGWWLWG
jgi:hypothetical protein